MQHVVEQCNAEIRGSLCKKCEGEGYEEQRRRRAGVVDVEEEFLRARPICCHAK
jgi:hypothetical protein